VLVLASQAAYEDCEAGRSRRRMLLSGRWLDCLGPRLRAVPGCCHSSLSPPSPVCRSGSYFDDLAWAACWLHIRTGEAGYLADAQRYGAAAGTYNR
jgi:hypothetical protein